MPSLSMQNFVLIQSLSSLGAFSSLILKNCYWYSSRVPSVLLVEKTMASLNWGLIIVGVFSIHKRISKTRLELYTCMHIGTGSAALMMIMIGGQNL